jgi:hypothetical protein
MFAPLEPNGDEAIRAIYDAGLIAPLGRTVDSSMEFKVPLLYRVGLGITQRGAQIRAEAVARAKQAEEELPDAGFQVSPSNGNGTATSEAPADDEMEL